MEAIILDRNFNEIAILDTYKSFIWTDRYDMCGDFEIKTEVDSELMINLKAGNYLYLKESDHLMISETMEIDTDLDEGNILTISGRSIESILERRVLYNKTIISGNLQEGIKKLIQDNIISPVNINRKIDNFIFEDNTDQSITELTIDAQYYIGDNLLDVISNICFSYSLGFKIYLNNNNQFVFKLYSGIDRSYNQETNPYVVFSPNFENIINSNLFQSAKLFKTVSLVMGSDKITEVEIDSGGGTGLDRREMFSDARDLTMYDGETTINEEEYTAQLQQRGKEELSDNETLFAFDGEVETGKMFVYGTDFFMGDIVQLENEYGIISRSRVVELVRSFNTEGYSIYPTFSAL